MRTRSVQFLDKFQVCVSNTLIMWNKSDPNCATDAHITSFLGYFRFFWSDPSVLMAHIYNHKWPISLITKLLGNCSVVSFQFCLNQSPKYQINHQFPHPSIEYSHCSCCPLLLFCSAVDTERWWRQWCVHYRWEKATGFSNLTVLIHGTWPHIGYVSDLEPYMKVAQVWFEDFSSHSPENNQISDALRQNIYFVWLQPGNVQVVSDISACGKMTCRI